MGAEACDWEYYLVDVVRELTLGDATGVTPGRRNTGSLILVRGGNKRESEGAELSPTGNN